jgi:tRNA G18 (ribose-2'-O)-methylase SpoU
MNRGFFAVGIYGCKTEANIGTLWRSAHLYGAAFVFTVGHRYQRQASDTPNTPLHTPMFNYATVDDLVEHLPWNAPLIGVEMDPRARTLNGYGHPERGVYLLGAEDHGLPQKVLDRCHSLIQIETALPQSMNVAVAGSIILHDRHVKTNATRPLVDAS